MLNRNDGWHADEGFAYQDLHYFILLLYASSTNSWKNEQQVC